MTKKPKESGFTLIENGLYDAMMLRQFSSYEYRVLMFIIRKTIGWHKSEDWISLSQFSTATNIKESHVSRALSMLLKQNIITKGGNRYHPLYGVQDKYWLWVELPKGVRSHHVELPKGDSKKGVKGLTKGGISDKKRGGTQNTIYINTKKLVTKGGNKEIKEEENAGSKDPTPKEKSETFFRSVERFIKDKESSPEVTEFLTQLHSKHLNIGKGKLWTEVKDFCMYWTEKTASGRQERWQLQKTFEVERRLVTWLNKAFNGFSKNHYQDNKPKGKEIII